MKRVFLLACIVSLIFNIGCSASNNTSLPHNNATPSTTPANNEIIEKNNVPAYIASQTDKGDEVKDLLSRAVVDVQKEVNLDGVHLYQAEPGREYDLLFHNYQYYSEHAFLLRHVYDEVSDDEKCGFVIEPQYVENNREIDYISIFEELGFEAYHFELNPESNLYSIIATKAQLNAAFGGENSKKKYGETICLIFPAPEKAFRMSESLQPKALQNVYKRAKTGDVSITDVVRPGEVKIMQPSLAKAISECNDPSVYFPVKIVLLENAYDKTGYTGIWELSDPFYFEGKDYEGNVEYFLTAATLKKYREDYEKWLKEVYLQSDYESDISDPLEAFEAEWKTKITNDEWDEYVRLSKKLEEFLKSYNDFVQEHVETRDGFKIDFGNGETNKIRDIMSIEYGSGLAPLFRSGAYLIDEVPDWYDVPNSLSLLLSKDQIEALASGTGRCGFCLYWAEY